MHPSPTLHNRLRRSSTTPTHHLSAAFPPFLAASALLRTRLAAPSCGTSSQRPTLARPRACDGPSISGAPADTRIVAPSVFKTFRSVANTFMIGSSLGGYLSLVANPHRIMHTNRCVNIFHPLDPLAQRLEPWVSPDVWAEALVSTQPDKLDFPLALVPHPLSASAFLERNAMYTPRKYDCACCLPYCILLIVCSGYCLV